MDHETHSFLKLTKLSTDITYDVLRYLLVRTYYTFGYRSFEEFLQNDGNRCTIANLAIFGQSSNGLDSRNGIRISRRQWHSMYSVPQAKGDHSCGEPVEGALDAVDPSLLCILLLQVRFLAEQNEDILDDIRTVLAVRQELISYSVLDTIVRTPYHDTLNRLQDALGRIGAKHAMDKTNEMRHVAYTMYYSAFIDKEKYTAEKRHSKLTALTVSQGHRALVKVFEKSLHQAGFKDFDEMLKDRFVRKDIRVTLNRQNREVRQLSPLSFDSLYNYQRSRWKTLKQIDENMTVHLLKKLNIIHMEIVSNGNRRIPEHVETVRRLRAKLFRNSNSSMIDEEDFRNEWIAATSAILQLSRFHDRTRNDNLVHEMSCIFNTDDLVQRMISKQRREKEKQSKPEFFRVYFDNPPDILNAYEFTRTKARILMEKLQGRGLQTGGLFDTSNNDLILAHRSQEEAEETITRLFQTCMDSVKVEPIRHPETDSELHHPWMILWHHSLRDDRNTEGLTIFGPTCTTLSDLVNGTNQVEDCVNLIWYGEDVEMKPLYDGLYSCLNQKLDKAIGQLDSHGATYRREIEKLRKLRLECAPPSPDGKWEVPIDLKKKLISLMPKTVKSFCIEDSVLTVYAAKKEHGFLKTEIGSREKTAKLTLRCKTANENIPFRRFCRQERALYSQGGVNEHRLGSVGLYSKLSSARTVPTSFPDKQDLAVITHGLFVQRNMRVFVCPQDQQNLTELGICVWPDHSLENDTVPVNDVAVIKITNQENLNVLHRAAAQSGRILRVYTGSRQRLKKKKIYKVGATTGKTHGYILHPSMTVSFGDDVCDAIIVQAEDSDTEFSEDGDSGAASKCRAEDNSLQAVSLIFSNWPLDDETKNAVLTTSIADGIDRYHNQTGQNLIVDNDFGLH